MQQLSDSLSSQFNKTQTRGEAKIKVACIGDSITELSGYPNHVKQTLGDSYIVGNFGACGTTVLLDSENPYIHSRAFAQARGFQPDIAIVLLGTNDANPNPESHQSHFVVDYLTLLNALKSLTSKPTILVVRPPHIFGETWLSGNVLSMSVVPAVDEAAKQASLTLIDVYSATDNPRLFFDGVHPNDEGAKIISDVICREVLKTNTG